MNTLGGHGARSGAVPCFHLTPRGLEQCVPVPAIHTRCTENSWTGTEQKAGSEGPGDAGSMRQVQSKDQGHGCHGLTQISGFANPNIPRHPLTDRYNPPSLLLPSLLQQHGAGPTSSRSHTLLSPAPGLLQLPCGDGWRAASPELAVGLEQGGCSGPCQPQPQFWASCGGGNEGEQSLAPRGQPQAAGAAAKPTHKAKRQRPLLSLLPPGWSYQLKSAAGRFSANKRPRLSPGTL